MPGSLRSTKRAVTRSLSMRWAVDGCSPVRRSEEHTSELQSRENLVCRHYSDLRSFPTRRSSDLGGPVQLAHRPEGGVADIEPRLDEVAQLEQADAELVDAGVAAIDEARGDQVVEYAVGRGRMQSGT